MRLDISPGISAHMAKLIRQEEVYPSANQRLLFLSRDLSQPMEMSHHIGPHGQTYKAGGGLSI